MTITVTVTGTLTEFSIYDKKMSFCNFKVMAESVQDNCRKIPNRSLYWFCWTMRGKAVKKFFIEGGEECINYLGMKKEKVSKVVFQI